MADAITDRRTLVHAADVATPYDDLAGGASGNLDTEIFIQGTGSIGENATNLRNGVLFDAGSTQNWSNNVFYIWINCGVVGLLDTKANGGFTIRFCGNTVTDWFEFDVGGSDSWPPSVNGGWTQFVIDIEATPSRTNGTTPATSAIRYVGWSAITASVMTRMIDNTWMDEIRRLPDGNAGITVEGRNGGTTPWTWADLPSELGIGVGTAKIGAGGAIVLNTPVEFFADDSTTHEFDDSNAIVLWENQEFAPSDLYGIRVLGAASGSADFQMGVKSGTGNDATGSQGVIIAADPNGVRWFWDSDAANIDTCNIYGCTFIHGADFQLDDAANEWISTSWVDCNTARVNNSLVLRCIIVDANTADGNAFMLTDDLDDIRFCTFIFSDGHAIEYDGPATQSDTFLGMTLIGYGANGTNDAALFNSNTSGTLTVGVQDGDSPTVRTAAGGTTVVNNAVTIRITVTDVDGVPIENARVEVTATETVGTVTTGDVLLTGLTNASGVLETTSFNYEAAFDPSGLDIRIKARKATGSPLYKASTTFGTVESGIGFQSIVGLILDE